MFSEEGIRPPLVIRFASPEAGTRLLLAPDCAEPSADEAVDGAEDARCRVLEVAEPAAQYRVEIVDDPSQAVASGAARLTPHLVLQRHSALLSDKAAPRLQSARATPV